MTPWEVAAAGIADAFAERGLVSYTTGAGATVLVKAVRSERDLQQGGRGIVYEFRAADLPADPTKQDHFTTAGRRWRVVEVPRGPNPAGGWELGAADDGAAP